MLWMEIEFFFLDRLFLLEKMSDRQSVAIPI